MARIKNVTKSVVNAAIKYKWFDYSYMLEIEKACLKDMSEKFANIGMGVSSEHDAQWMKVCVKLIDIIQAKDISYKREEHVEPLGLGFDKNLTKTYFSHVNIKYVNTRNAFRFMRCTDEQFLEDALYKDELRVIKAMRLYNNIRANFMFGWSD